MDAVDRWLPLVTKNPNNELAQYSLARAYVTRGDLGAAVQCFQRAVALKPDWMAAHIELGQAALRLGDRETARRVFTTALRLAEAQQHSGPRAELMEALASLDP